MSRTEIRVSGFGGQGVVLLGHIIGHACAIDAGKHATMIQSFGPEARGSACSATLAVDETEVLYPYITRPDYLVAMSLEAYDLYHEELKDEGTLIFESSLVTHTPKKGQPCFGIPSTRIAETLGRTIVQNIVMLGFFAAVSQIVSYEQMSEAVKGSVPAGTEEMNLEAFNAGWNYYQDEYAGKKAEELEPTV